MNKQGKRPDSLEFNNDKEKPKTKPLDILSDNSLTRFDKKKPSSDPNSSVQRRRSNKSRPSGGATSERKGETKGHAAPRAQQPTLKSHSKGKA